MGIATQTDQILVIDQLLKKVSSSHCKNYSRPHHKPLVCLLFSCLPMLSPLVKAGDWEAEYGVGIKENFTDNYCLSRTDKGYGWITSVRPYIAVDGSGGRSDLTLAASLFHSISPLNSDDCSRDNQIRLNVIADGSVEIAKDLFYLDGSIRALQNAVDPFNPTGDAVVSFDENMNSTYSFALSPYIKHQFGYFANFFLKYSYTDQTNSESQVSDNSRQSANFSLSNLQGRSRLGWDITGNYQKVNYTTDSDTSDNQPELASVYLSLNYMLTRKLSIYGYSGKDINDYQSSREEVEDDAWMAGIDWAPNKRLRVKLGSGKHYYGDTPTVDINYRHKRSQLDISYNTTLEFTSYLREIPIFGLIVDENGFPIIDEQGNFIISSGSQTTLTQGPVVDERLRVRYQWATPKTIINVNAVASNQTREEDGLESTFTTASLGITRNLSKLLSVTGELLYYEADPQEDSILLGPRSDTYRLYLGIDRKLGPRTRVNAGYNYTERQSDDGRGEYQENRFTVGVTVGW